MCFVFEPGSVARDCSQPGGQAKHFVAATAARLITLLPLFSLQAPVATLAKALPMLLDVLLLCLFAFFVFGIVAVQLFAGALRNRYVRSHLLSASRAANSRHCGVTAFGSRAMLLVHLPHRCWS